MIWISQWLCPSRHCSIAIPWDDQVMTREQVEEKGEDLYRRKVLHRWCGICRGELHVEHSPTKFKTMDDAMPYLRAAERANSSARGIIGGKF